MQYQIIDLLLSYVNIIVYLDVIENPIEYQYELSNVWGTRAENWENLFTEFTENTCIWIPTSLLNIKRKREAKQWYNLNLENTSSEFALASFYYMIQFG